MADTLNVVNYDEAGQSLIRTRKLHDPAWEARVRRKIYEHVSWNTPYKDEPVRGDSNRQAGPGQTLDQVFEKKIEKSAIGQFLEEAKIPANRY